MPAIAFLVVSFLCGFEITKRMKVNIWGRIAAGIGIGYLISGWIVYIVSYFSKVVLGLTHPKVYGFIDSYFSVRKYCFNSNYAAVCISAYRKR